jgi:hypothetical protein
MLSVNLKGVDGVYLSPIAGRANGRNIEFL